jgi:hypothetical protein
MVFALFSKLCRGGDYGEYAMQGSFSDDDTFAGAVYDGSGSGDDTYGVRCLPPSDIMRCPPMRVCDP